MHLFLQRAAQIRSTPFTGDSSSDSSSDEEEYYSQVAVTTPSSESEAVMSVAGPSGTNVTMSLTVRKQVNQTSSRATKRGQSLLMMCVGHSLHHHVEYLMECAAVYSHVCLWCTYVCNYICVQL